MVNIYDAVLLIGFGGPTRREEIRPYLENVLRGRPVPAERLEEVVHNYEAIGCRSPFNELTFRQAEGLQRLLKREGPQLPVYVGMRNWHPLFAETLEQMILDGIKRVIGIILAPHQGEASWGRYQVSLQQAVLEVQTKTGLDCPSIDYNEPWFKHPLFIEAVADKLRCKMDKIPFDQRNDVQLLFTAHSVPTPMSKPYQDQLLETCAAVAEEIGLKEWGLVYQSRSGNPRDPWLEPDVCNAIQRLADDGCKNVLLAPIGFVCDHVEVLFDLDLKARQVAEERKMGFYRACTVNDHPSFIRMMADVVQSSPGRAYFQMNGWPSDLSRRVVVVGGGISGLAAAHRLQEESQRLQFPVNIKLLEASGRLGGVIQTVERDGFLLEKGPDSFISEKPWGIDLCQQLGLAPHLIGSGRAHRRSFIVRRGTLLPVPDGFYLLAPTQIWPFVTTPIFSWLGKLRIAADLILPRKNYLAENQDESLADFVRRRLGQEALERMAQPMVGGIYTSDPEQLSLRATMPRFLEMEQRYRSVILGILRQRRRMASAREDQPRGPRYSLFLSFDRGMQSLVNSLQSKLPAESVCLNTTVDSLDRNPASGRWVLNLGDGTRLEADAVCLALASYQSANLLKHHDSALAQKLRLVSYASTATVNLAYRRAAIPHSLDGFGFVVPAIERRQILACTFCHVKFEGRAPQDQALLRAFVGGALQPKAFELEDHEMTQTVRRDLHDLLGISAEPIFSQVERHPQAMAQYQVGHLQWVAEIESRIQESPTLQLAGNAFTGVGIPDCVHRGEECADRILAALRADRPQGVGSLRC